MVCEQCPEGAVPENKQLYDERIGNQLAKYQGLMRAGAALMQPIFQNINRVVMTKKGVFAVCMMLPFLCIAYNIWNYFFIDLTNLETASGTGSITDFTAFYEVAATSDVWIYAGSNWGSTTMSAAVLVRLAQ